MRVIILAHHITQCFWWDADQFFSFLFLHEWCEHCAPMDMLLLVPAPSKVRSFPAILKPSLTLLHYQTIYLVSYEVTDMSLLHDVHSARPALSLCIFWPLLHIAYTWPGATSLNLKVPIAGLHWHTIQKS